MATGIEEEGYIQRRILRGYNQGGLSELEKSGQDVLRIDVNYFAEFGVAAHIQTSLCAIHSH